VRTADGRLFQTSGPQTANTRRPSSVRVRRVMLSEEIVTVGLTHRRRRGRRRTTDTVELWLSARRLRVWLHVKRRRITLVTSSVPSLNLQQDAVASPGFEAGK